MASKLPATAKHVAHAIIAYADADGGNSYPSLRTLADDTSMSTPTVQKGVRALESGGWIARTEYVRGRVRHFVPLIPSGVTALAPKPARRKRKPTPAQLAALAKGRAHRLRRLGEVSNEVAHPSTPVLVSVQKNAVSMSKDFGSTGGLPETTRQGKGLLAQAGAHTREDAVDTATTATDDTDLEAF